ncbi:hypothetical protein [Rhodococcus sp. BS-15]|uniref:hypothetical protein n=1 Tax=Rhodococcus sp. BS-15 TaxID=1304954 RepID=UPI0011AE6EA0|nr:hypothetical protein [Rhodococcus sp. BS-15]
MPIIFVDDERRSGPNPVQTPRSDNGSGHVASTVDQYARHLAQICCAVEQRRIAEPVVCPVVRG